MRNMELFEVAEKGIEPAKKAAFANCFIGAISVLSSKEDWEEALRTATRLVGNYHPSVKKEPVTRGR